MNIDKDIKELSNEELSRVSGCAGEGNLFEGGYEYPGYPGIWYIYDLTLGAYRMVDKSNGNEKIARNASDFEETASELMKLR